MATQYNHNNEDIDIFGDYNKYIVKQLVGLARLRLYDLLAFSVDAIKHESGKDKWQSSCYLILDIKFRYSGLWSEKTNAFVSIYDLWEDNVFDLARAVEYLENQYRRPIKSIGAVISLDYAEKGTIGVYEADSMVTKKVPSSDSAKAKNNGDSERLEEIKILRDRINYKTGRETFSRTPNAELARELLEVLKEAGKEIDWLWFKLDEVMVEHCPEEMTEFQKVNWAENQRFAK